MGDITPMSSLSRLKQMLAHDSRVHSPIVHYEGSELIISSGILVALCILSQALDVYFDCSNMPPGEHKHPDKSPILDEMIILKSNGKLVHLRHYNVEFLVCACKVAQEYPPVANGHSELFAQESSQLCNRWRVLLLSVLSLSLWRRLRTAFHVVESKNLFEPDHSFW